MTSGWAFLHSLQYKLIVAFVLLVVAALVLAGSLFVWLSRGEEEQRALDHAAAAAPAIYSDFLQRLLRGDSPQELEAYAREAAQQYDVRLLILDPSSRVVLDSSDDLTGEQLAVPSSVDRLPDSAPPTDPYRSWRLAEGSPGGDLILLAPFPPPLPPSQPVSAQPLPVQTDPIAQGLFSPYRLVMAVGESTIARAWLGLLPGLLIAAAIALPVAVALAVAVAGYVTRPLSRLTAAAHQMAQGTFDVDVSVGRRDEVGQLAQAFSTMAMRVGESYQQMRTLVANVSHDVRTPLTSILGFAHALRDGVVKGEAESKHVGEVIYDEVSRLSSRLNDLLYLSELESGQAVLQRDEIDLRTLVDGVVRRVMTGAEDRGVEVFTDLGEGIIISADSPKLERALENLLDNARKFTPPGGEIRVRTFVDEDGGGQVSIEVANSAPDVEAEELPRLFERFYRRDRARTERSAGAGLGLPIARDLIEMHGGTLEASLRDGDIVLTAKMPRA
ncbi:MAG: HAMP domain-containing sensor histidine kinase [Bacillota bacterium]|nr:HAMP domain-containing sensor histidine kinase [Bacillota bacterium]